MKATFLGLSSQGELGSKTYTLQYLRKSHVNGVYTPKGETNMADTPQRTKNKISEKLTSERTKRTLSPVR
jgi:hypothetical protein